MTALTYDVPLFDLPGGVGLAVAEGPVEPPAPRLVTLPQLVLPEPALVVVVRGLPGPQGSKSHKGNGVLVESSALVKPWRDSVAWQAVAAKNRRRGYQLLTGPVYAEMVFSLPRPKGHFGTGRNAGQLRPAAPRFPDVKPDLSKLIRSTEDALSGVAYRDDALIVQYVRLGKWYVTDAGVVPGVLDTPGCTIRLWAAPIEDGGEVAGHGA
ncbi:RusA family crossover junction endodeoxyribonuclease [Kitasatospora sp. NPDC058046]|uniref:RusA family crossover junction endodeoxyribonuclease n=1 Tax=Kitasatospora sp. NPDC058046 TaxID=3346312 RepID=UPI0036D8611E